VEKKKDELNDLGSSRKPLLRPYWVERGIFCIGAIILFIGQFVLTDFHEMATEKTDYYDLNVPALHQMELIRKQAFSNYNRSVSDEPQNPKLVGQAAYDLYVATNNILTQLQSMLEIENPVAQNEMVQQRRNEYKLAETELLSGKYETLVSRMNVVHRLHESSVEDLTTGMMLQRHQAISDKKGWERRVKHSSLLGTILFGLAFLLRERREYLRQKTTELGKLKT